MQNVVEELEMTTTLSIQPTWNVIKGIGDLIRLPLCIMASIAGFTAGIIVLKLQGGAGSDIIKIIQDHYIEATIGIWIPFLMVGGAMAINDYFDYESDKINQRLDRPLVRGVFPRSFALTFGSAMIGLGILITILVFQDLALLVLVLFFTAIAYGYNLYLKESGIAGNVLVSFSYAAPYALGAFAMKLSDPTITVTIIVMVAITFFGALGREFLKGIMDIEGDRARGIKTVAVTKGPKVAALASNVMFFIVLVLSPIPFILSYAGNLVYLVFIIITDGFLLLSGIPLLLHPTKENSKRGRMYTRLALWTGAIAFLLGALTL